MFDDKMTIQLHLGKIEAEIAQYLQRISGDRQKKIKEMLTKFLDEFDMDEFIKKEVEKHFIFQLKKSIQDECYSKIWEIIGNLNINIDVDISQEKIK